MPRALYNTTADFIDGPNGASPGVVRVANVACRLVESQVIDEETQPWDEETHYLTCDTPAIGPNTAWSESSPGELVVTANGGFADRVAVPSGSPAAFIVVWLEAMPASLTNGAYYRMRLVPLGGTWGSV